MCSGPTAVVEVIEDGPRVRIIRYTLAPGAETGWHRHGLDYVIVPYQDCRLRVLTQAGEVEATMHRDQPYFRSAGAEHNVVSANAEPFSFLEIELKS